jgi:autotransporter-associated beta strand protein
MKSSAHTGTDGLLKALACVLLAGGTARAATNTWTNKVDGSWSVASNWDAAGVPLNDGTADVVFNNPTATAWTTPTVDAAWAAAGAVNSLSFLLNTPGMTVAQGAGVTGLTLGAGGLKLDATQAGGHKEINVNLTLAASQKWFVEMSSYNNENRFLTINRDIASPPGVSWVLGGRTRCVFNAGSSTGFQGQVTLNGNVCLNSVGQYGRLGPHPVIVNASPNLAAAGSVGAPRLVFNGVNSGPTIMPSAFVLELTNSTHNPFQLYITANNGTLGTGTVVEFTNTWSGAIVGGGLNNGGHVRPNVPFSFWDDRHVFKFSGDASALAGPTDGSSSYANQSICLTRAYLVLNHPHAWGASNSLSILAGNWNSNVPGIPSGVLATHGNTVNADIRVQRVEHGTLANAQSGPVVLGLYGTGLVTFASTIRTLSVNAAGDRNTLNFLRLTAPADGTARFTGKLASSTPTDAYNGPLQVLGLGDVVLSGTNQSFKGDTLIRSGRLLLGAPGVLSKGTNPVNLGDDVSLPAGGPVRVATVIPLSPSAWTAGSYTFSSAPSIDGIVPVLNDRVLVKDEATAANRNGIYVVSTADGKTWVRAGDLDASAEFVYGLRVTVTSGTVNAGKAFFLFNRQNILGSTFTLDTTNVGFNPEPSPNPDVALLTAAALTVSENVVVTNNSSSGTATLGGASAHASTFSGTVTLHRATQLAAASGGTATFSGPIGGAGGVTKTGAGVVRLTSVSNSYSGGTGIRATVDELAAGGRLEVPGALDLSGVADALEIIGTPDPDTTYTLATYGTLNGEFDTVTSTPKHTVVYDGPGNTILLKPLSTGTVIAIR